MPLAPADSPETLARVKEGMELVDLLARQLRRNLGPSTDYDDLASAGREGLLAAARSYDPSHGVPFRRWANLRVRGAMMDAVRSQSALPRRVYAQLRAMEAGDRVVEAANEDEVQRPPTGAAEADSRLSGYLAGIATAMTLGVISPSAGPDPDDVRDTRLSAEEQVAERELIELVRSVVDQQPDAERHLLKRHYFDGVTFEQAAKEIGLSKSWASRIHARAIEALTRELRRVHVE